MLKTFSNIISNATASTKCAEIFYQSTKDFTIVCTFCDIKTFQFEDFLVHFNNIHSADRQKKSKVEEIDCKTFLDVSVKCEVGVERGEIQSPPIQREHVLTCSNGVEDDYEVEEDEDLLCLWQKKENKLFNKNHKTDDWSGAEIDKELANKNHGQKSRENDKQKDVKIETHKCELCNKAYKSEPILKAHTRRIHVKEKEVGKGVISCPVCTKPFSSFRCLEQHCLEEHGGIPCNECEKKCKTRRKLSEHLATHGVRSYACDFENCDKSFYTKKGLRGHKEWHNCFKKYVCETCGYSCRKRQALEVHIRSHTGEKPYSCQLCLKRFAYPALLKEHQASHTSVRTHVCDVCGASFTRQKSLYHHKHLHLAIKKFICKLCGNAYAQAAGLAGHMRKHKEEGLI